MTRARPRPLRSGATAARLIVARTAAFERPDKAASKAKRRQLLINSSRNRLSNVTRSLITVGAWAAGSLTLGLNMFAARNSRNVEPFRLAQPCYQCSLHLCNGWIRRPGHD